eukprot:NODE_22101_length_723_cov_0.823826.p2 GENE.NODE_22101_length_723_cov_0.823826~~NODE_22101_length_723_cov_0.823826.p2  ORF type:complete len:69 (+),score=7.66 NODE_22101_length_723_cov_0.823826:413-619(+)
MPEGTGHRQQVGSDCSATCRWLLAMRRRSLLMRNGPSHADACASAEWAEARHHERKCACPETPPRASH